VGRHGEGSVLSSDRVGDELGNGQAGWAWLAKAPGVAGGLQWGECALRVAGGASHAEAAACLVQPVGPRPSHDGAGDAEVVADGRVRLRVAVRLEAVRVPEDRLLAGGQVVGVAAAGEDE